ncbi:glycine cleavage system aminomethyltransferase GcvT [Paeniglutamicibacter sp. Y32M11]|uniref:glycine cleavage system aminomethyltransferase GcvT n=1 Tax=Paeniglutamicibacter sp. Y32M11 TaxID=2853258 RepID=UPI0010514A93|nr:glycine cleavage system aminomethyltransferase GcvT [Paeniglutamicibacter sp. Y32M11]QXQ09571.1 glycine cleavage system aminomethyltransferase GcvT [Paeniglutamicibacter sp. Y32M11]
MSDPKKTSLHAKHAELNASFTDFGGWDMPLKYGSELAEHNAVRATAGLFDLSHMGEVWVEGPAAATFLNTALAGNMAVMKVGKAKYSVICNEAGGIIDDLITYRRGEEKFLVVPNAGNAPVVAAALAERAAGFDVTVTDASAETSLIAVQGPNAVAILHELVDEAGKAVVTEMNYYAADELTVAGINVLLARTGYTGEDGFELYVPNEQAAELWDAVMNAGTAHGLIPAGLACRDSLRLEAGMPLYGNELSLEGNPFEANLGPIVSFKKEENFVGRAALEAIKAEGPKRVLVGLKGLGRRAGRGGYAVSVDGAQIGAITSGQPSPTLGFPVAMAYVEPAFAEVGTKVDVDLRGKPEAFEVVSLPFYTRAK